MFNLFKKTKTSSEVLKVIFQGLSQSSASLRKERDTWKDEEVSFATYSKESECLLLFTAFCAIQESKLPANEKVYLLDLFREVLSGDVRAGKVDAQIEVNLQDYCDAANAPYPPHLSPLWNVGEAFARHIGAEKQTAYVAPAGTSYGAMLLSTVKFLNGIGKSYRIVRG